MNEQRVLVADRARAMVQAHLRHATATGMVEDEAIVVGASVRGLCLLMSQPPETGEIVDVLVGRQVLAGQVRWRRGKRCSVSLSEPICVMALLEGGAVPIVLSAEAAAAYEHRRPLAAALASDGPLPARLLQAFLILGVLVCSIVVVARVVTPTMEPLNTLHIAATGESDLGTK
ncbi:hypothetical protein EDF56_11136 [Novosphingobium sp. PhB165]|uniref:hypothetical protein n=1 Tax=Novosphingobium sp. PhB165 TaxID=2485105 RepID=UPI00104C7D5A|nr:hypothetical protein [Novosphingobium sp. PhB165]TCM14990.1 hypothetical protein EDF56_11136 [Novosphingobium sp. PhB165]